MTFYARSYSNDSTLGKFIVKMSVDGDEIEDFIHILHHGFEHLEAPSEWTLFHFNLGQLSGNTARFAIQNISTDGAVLLIDNFMVFQEYDTVTNQDVEIIPQNNVLSQNYPNPFNPETSIDFTLKEAGNVALEIYNIRGQKVKTLLNDRKEAGKHSIIWNGTDDNNKSVSSGIYLYRIRNGRFTSTRKMILMK